MSIKKSKYNIVDIIHLLLSILVLLWLNKGIFNYTSNYIPSIMRYMIFAIWFMLTLNQKQYIRRLISNLWPILLFYILAIFINCFSHNSYIDSLLKNINFILIIYSIFLYYFEEKYLQYQKIILSILVFDICYIALNTIKNLKENPSLSRFLSTGAKTQVTLLGNKTFYAIGNYSYFYSLVILIMLIFFILVHINKNRIFNLILFILLTHTLIQGQFTIAIIFLTIFLLWIICMKIINKKNRILVFILLIILMIITLNFLPEIFNKILSLKILPDTVSIRIKELEMMLLGYNMNDTDLNSRLSLYTKSLNSFCSNIFVGSFGSDNIGGHSTWLDLLGLFGILSTPIFVFFIKAYRYIKNRVGEQFIKFVDLYWIYYILLGVVNTTLFSNIFIMLFIVVPFTILYIENKINKSYFRCNKVKIKYKKGLSL